MKEKMKRFFDKVFSGIAYLFLMISFTVFCIWAFYEPKEFKAKKKLQPIGFELTVVNGKQIDTIWIYNDQYLIK